MGHLLVNFNASINFDAKLKEFMDAKTNDSLERAAKRRNTEEAVKSNIE